MGHVDKLKDFIFTQKRTASIRDVSHTLDVHVSEARKILEEFVAEENKKSEPGLDVTYVITGRGKDSPDGHKVLKIVHVKAADVGKAKEDFESVTSCKINSVAVKDLEAELELSPKVPLIDREVILKQQKLTYIVNDDIQLRTDRLERLKLISGVAVNGQDVTVKSEGNPEESKNLSKKGSLGKDKTSKEDSKISNKRGHSNRKNASNKKQTKLTGFGSKAMKSEKSNSSKDSGFSIESTPDPFSEEEEEEDKTPEREEIDDKVEPMDVDSQSPPSKTKVEEELDDDEVERKISMSEDEAIVLEEPKKVKKESKKRKRVRIYDSDEEDEEAMALRILGAEEDSNSNHSSGIQCSLESKKSIEEEPEETAKQLPAKKSKKKSKPSQPMETKTISEEFTDDDGYTQVRLVKKLVPVEENEVQKEETTESLEENKNDKSKSKVKIEKPALKKQKTEEEDESDGGKPKAKKLSKAAQAKKGQVSITNFFKPAAKV